MFTNQNAVFFMACGPIAVCLSMILERCQNHTNLSRYKERSRLASPNGCRPCNVCMTFLPQEVDAFVRSNPTMEEAIANLPQHQADHVAKVSRLARPQLMNMLGACCHLHKDPTGMPTDWHRRPSVQLKQLTAEHVPCEYSSFSYYITTASMHCRHDEQ